jgi:hypothetical protein
VTNVNWSAALAALVPKGVVIVMSTVPAPAGDVAETVVLLTTENDTAAVVPKSTALAPVKLVPVIMTTVPPDEGPLVGLMPEMAGGGGLAYVNRSAGPVALVPKAVVIVMSTGLTPGGDVAETEVLLSTENDAAGVTPKSTAEAPVKPVPVIATTVPPAKGPLVGLIPVMVGGGLPAEQTCANASKTTSVR